MLIGDARPGEDSYLPAGSDQWGDPRQWERSWSWRGTLRSVKWRGGGIVKSAEPFDEHGSIDALTALLIEASARGVERPSGYGDLFHQRCHSPVTQAHVRKLFPAVPGGWQRAIVPGRTRQPLYQYDIRSAYLWALAQGFPAPDSFVTAKRVNGPGLYLVESPAHPLLPHPWCLPGRHPATEEEVRAFNLDHRSVVRGIGYLPDSFVTAGWVTDIAAWTCWKAVGRAFWGRWASQSATMQTTYDRDGRTRTERALKDPTRNPIWAALITSRIRLRLWDVCWQQPVQRVFVDSVVTTAPLDCSPAIGGWKEVGYFPDGGYITGPKVIGRCENRAA